MTEKYFDVNKDGHSIRCKLYCSDPKNIGWVVLFGHGFGGHKDNRAAERFARKAVSKNKKTAVVTFDWPCHGEDARKNLLLSDCDSYMQTLLSDLKERFGTETIYAYATSFGGYLILKYILEHGNPFVRIALRCPAVNMYKLMLDKILSKDDLEKMRRGKPVLVGFDRKVRIAKEFLEDLKGADITGESFIDESESMIIFHGVKDEIVPFEEVRKFADDNIIEFVPVEKADHRFSDPGIMDAVIAEILKFMELD